MEKDGLIFFLPPKDGGFIREGGLIQKLRQFNSWGSLKSKNVYMPFNSKSILPKKKKKSYEENQDLHLLALVRQTQGQESTLKYETEQTG